MKPFYSTIAALTIAIPGVLTLSEAPALSFSITRNNLSSQLLNNLLGNTTGLSNFDIQLVGDGRAFGTFQNDPFGLNSGVVMSTGKVTDLVGKNISDGGFSPGTSIPLTFTKLPGNAGIPPFPTGVYYADLSSIGVDINSITIADSGSGVGGAGGKLSGFDLDAIKFSNILATSATEVNALVGLDVFDFSPGRTFFTPGNQRPSVNPPVQRDLFGTINGNVNNAVATLDSFDADGSIATFSGAVSLGDGGKIGFNLKSTIPQGNPLYLYIGESADNGEVAAGNISVSNRPISGLSDLSTDFGLPGAFNDTISLQIDFDVDDTVDQLFFQYVFGSEELVEYGGSAFNDAFSLELNGFNLATLSDAATVNINNLAPSSFGSYHPDLIYNPVGTGPASNITKLDGYTKPLIFVGDLEKNARNSLVITLKDTRDGLLDSAVFLKGGTFGTVRPPDIDGGTARVPEPSFVLGLLSFAALGAASVLKQQWKQNIPRYKSE